ncbi:MAG: PEP-CTERM sorting domain-containing protein [Acidobacteriota bacterium]|nr:PEP-CTERM sorting domain-containing protein [Acidobacteriota bacterium]
MQFGFSKHVYVDWGDWKAGTGYEDFGPTPILIRGTAGEGAGTPINLLLSSTFAADAGYPPAVPSLQINGTPCGANGAQLIQTLKIGDIFQFGAVLDGAPDARGELIVDLFVSEEVGAAPAPEPAAVSLLGGGLTMLTVMVRRRKS